MDSANVRQVFTVGLWVAVEYILGLHANNRKSRTKQGKSATTSICPVSQDCGKPFYTTNYLAFFYAIKQRYPDMQLIANCNMGQEAPTEMWDW